MYLHFEALFTSERSSTFLGVFFWGISILGVVFILGAVFIAILTMSYCTIKISIFLFRSKKFPLPKNSFAPSLKITHPLYAKTLFMQGTKERVYERNLLMLVTFDHTLHIISQLRCS